MQYKNSETKPIRIAEVLEATVLSSGLSIVDLKKQGQQTWEQKIENQKSNSLTPLCIS